MNKLQKIREKIIEANPSILDLVFGCEYIRCEPSGDGSPTPVLTKFTSLNDYKKHSVSEIIGRPIIIDDVLITCNFDYKEWNADNHDKITNLLDIWQLGKPLSEQKPEVINFLYDILITNK